MGTTVWDHKAYYPGAHQTFMRVTGDRRSGLLLGAQIIGHWQSQVAKRIDIFAAAIFAGMKVEEINDLDLSYTSAEQSVGPRSNGGPGVEFRRFNGIKPNFTNGSRLRP